MAAFNSGLGRRGMVAGSLLALLLAATVGIGLWHVVSVDSLVRVGAVVSHVSAVASVVRGILIGSLALAWPRLLARLQRRNSITTSDRAILLAARWRIVGWLLIVEMMLGQQLLSYVVRAWSGSA